VLEYVPDPARCVQDIHRVLKPDGVVYSEVPFMQQVHSQSDFTRFTELGHRRLFRNFTPIASGATGGPGMALAWSLRHFLMSFYDSRWARDLVKVVTSCLFFWMKYLDIILTRNGGGLDAASGTFFLGRKSTQLANDLDLIANYRGAIEDRQIFT
jgi:SAM-dependent methyltransferase